MICRRRRVFLVALLCGLAWFLLLPSLSYFYTNSNRTPSDTDSEPVVNNLRFPRESSSRNFHIPGRDAEKQMEGRDDDLSEIDYDRPVEKMVTHAKSGKKSGLNVPYTSHSWTLMARHRHAVSPFRGETAGFKLPSAKFKSPGFKSPGFKSPGLWKQLSMNSIHAIVFE